MQRDRTSTYRPRSSAENYAELAALGRSVTLSPRGGRLLGQHPFEVGQHQDVKQFRTGSWPEGIAAFTELPLDLLQVHGVGH